jgi:tetratricopeptide (TPR) repeat protein
MALQGRLDEAEEMLRDILARLETAFADSYDAVVRTKTKLATVLFAQARMEEGDRYFHEALASRAGDSPTSRIVEAELRRDYGRLLHEHGRHGEAEDQMLASLSILETAYPDVNHPNVVESRRALMRLYESTSRPELAERYRAPEGRFFAY